MQGRSLRITIYICATAAFILICALLFYSHAFGPVSSDTTNIEVVITPTETLDDISANLKEAGLIRYEWAFRIAYLGASAGHSVRPGGYEISSSMDVWTVASTLTKSPYLAWVVIPPGLRKEQIGALLAKTLSWTTDEQASWMGEATSPSPSYEEGVYYPDTYLIPSDQSPVQVAGRIRDRFNQVFKPYLDQATGENIKWTTVLNIASLIEREAAGPDMKLIAGIIWNRLNKHMALQIDASLQYIKGNADTGWWPVVKSEDKYLDSPFNTYKHTGLPPHPIAEPSLAAIDAVLNPQTTNCIYYLHDTHGLIHCSPTYAGHVANINRYLK